jgi:Leucine-rich repeat (LRR) protein
MPHLDTLLAKGCSLEALPTSLGRLSALTCLHVPLNKLTVLPPSIGRLRQLTELDASGNATLIDLPEQLSQGCVRLQTIRLGECSGLNLPTNLVELASLARVTVAARQVAVAAAEVRELLESGRIEVTLT